MGPAPPAGRTPRRTDTPDPRRSRDRALRVLFEADVRGVDPAALLARLADDPAALATLDAPGDDADAGEQTGGPAGERSSASLATPDRRSGRRRREPGLDGFTRRLVEGVAGERAQLDDLLGRHARGWSVPRMPVVDRNVLRLAAFELLHEATPAAVVIDEAVTLAKRFSTEDSGRWVNGVLEAVRRERDGT